MSICPYEALIRTWKEALGYAQEAPADGVCPLSGLTRVEDSEQQQTGASRTRGTLQPEHADYHAGNHASAREFILQGVKYRIRQAVFQNRTEDALELLDEYEAVAERENPVNEQLLLLYRTILAPDLPILDREERFLAAIKLTKPGFDPPQLPLVLSHEEVVCIANYAKVRGEAGDLSGAIVLYDGLDRFLEQNKGSSEVAVRTQLTVLFHLSGYLEMAGRYRETAAASEKGIRISRESERCGYLDQFLFTKAKALLMQGQEALIPEARESLRLAICAAEAVDARPRLQHYQNYMQTYFEAANDAL